MFEATADIKQAEKIVDIEYANALLDGSKSMAGEVLEMLVDSLPEEIIALENAYQAKEIGSN